MSCCADGKPCGGHVGGEAGLEGGRYPTPVGEEEERWMASPGAERQHVAGGGEAAPQLTPEFTYSGAHLAACNFPLGGFGAGQVILQGDGTLQGWTVVNQCRADDGAPDLFCRLCCYSCSCCCWRSWRSWCSC